MHNCILTRLEDLEVELILNDQLPSSHALLEILPHSLNNAAYVYVAICTVARFNSELGIQKK